MPLILNQSKTELLFYRKYQKMSFYFIFIIFSENFTTKLMKSMFLDPSLTS